MVPLWPLCDSSWYSKLTTTSRNTTTLKNHTTIIKTQNAKNRFFGMMKIKNHSYKRHYHTGRWVYKHVFKGRGSNFVFHQSICHIPKTQNPLKTNLFVRCLELCQCFSGAGLRLLQS
jgi:hypothetical protein